MRFSDALRRRSRAGISMIQQELHPVPARSVMENIWLGRFPRGRLRARGPRPDAARHTTAVPRHRGRARSRCPGRRPVGLPGPAHGDRPRGLVRRARGDHGRADLVALASTRCSACSALIADLRAKGVAVIYISHKLEEIMAISDEVSIMRDGRMIGTWPTASLTIGQVITRMVGREPHGPLPGPPRDARATVLLEVDALTSPHPGLVPGRVVPAAPRRGAGHRRPRGRAAHRARRGHLRPARRSPPGPIRVNGREAGHPLAHRRQAPGHGAAHRGSPRLGRRARRARCSRTSILAHMPRYANRLGHRGHEAGAPRRATRARPAARPDALAPDAAHEPLGRQPAEGAVRPLAARRARRSSSSTSPRGASTWAPSSRSTRSSTSSPHRGRASS